LGVEGGGGGYSGLNVFKMCKNTNTNKNERDSRRILFYSNNKFHFSLKTTLFGHLKLKVFFSKFSLN
jgi:hypothetical protein